MPILSAQLADGPVGSSLAAWWPVWAFAGVFAGLLVVLFIYGTLRTDARVSLRVPAALEQVSGVPAWAATTLLFSIYGLAFAGYGFYTDVAYHVAFGRDDDLFTAPHTAIFAGLCMIAAAPLAGVRVATAQRLPTRLRLRKQHVPWSLVPLGVLGIAAVSGFPIDDVWHRQYGVDVTMWSPPHLLMILGASFSGLASWLVLAEAGVRPNAGAWGRGLHLVVAMLTLQGLSSVQGEFSFGVPQWQQLYHPVLVCLAAGIALPMIRIVHGRVWTLVVTAALFAFQAGGGDPVATRAGAIYIGSAVAVELVALTAGTARRLRFALLCGLGIATLGLGVEWLWNQGAHQPWTPALLPEAVLVGGLAALAGAMIGTALGGAVSGDAGGSSRDGVRTIPVAAAALAVACALAALAIPFPRRVGEVTAHVTLDWVDAERAVVEVRLDPPDAAEGARWFTVGSWQWGGRTIRHLEQTGPGEYTSREPVLLAGWAKSLVRLHRGAEMMAVAVRLPADPAYSLAAVPAEDRTAPFVSEQRYLQREAARPTGWLAPAVYTLVLLLAAAWVAAVWVAAGAVGRRGSPMTTPAASLWSRSSGASRDITGSA